MLQISIIDMTLKMTNLKLQQHFPGDNELTQPRKTTTTYMAFVRPHYSDVIMIAMASQITSIKIVCSTIYLGTNQRKHQSSALLAFVREICRWMELCMHTKNMPLCLRYQLLIKVHEWEIDCNDVSLLFGYKCCTLKRKCCHFDEILITDCTESCHFDNFRCSQWWKFRQNDDISVSV